MYVIGTAGHVDHGKSTLVEALSGIDPDRLAEEKAREMTIDLGFAWLALPGLVDEDGTPSETGIVDVPGHRDFIENMLAGVGGLDLALFVVAADEGVMPQTREHLAILDLLQVPGGVVALTKTDLVDDPDWLELVILDLADTLSGTVLAEAPIIPVSARTGAGLDELRDTLSAALQATPPRPDQQRPRLPIDRVFTLSGFGTIVTGTLTGGSLGVGDTVEIQPAGLAARIRGLQTHRTKREVARPGSRVAVNLSGVDKDELQRGDVLARPGVVRGTRLVDVQYEHLLTAGGPLKHNQEVKFFSGAAEVLARTRVIGSREIAPGESGWLQLALREPAALLRHDRFILRRPSPPATLGGGRVLDPHPGRQYRRFRPQTITRLKTLAEGTPAEMLLHTLARKEPLPQQQLLRESGLGDTAQAAWETLQAEKQVVAPAGQALTTATWASLQEQVTAQLAAFHRENPLRPGMSREALRGGLRPRPDSALYNALLEQLAAYEAITLERGLVHLPDHAIVFSAEQQGAIDRLMRRMEMAGFNGLSPAECREMVGEAVYYALVTLGELVPVGGDVVYPAGIYTQVRAELVGFIRASGRVSAAGVRDHFHTSRKYAIAWLEHLDEERVTRRVGDERELI